MKDLVVLSHFQPVPLPEAHHACHLERSREISACLTAGQRCLHPLPAASLHLRGR
jgi:hypothetical protein